MVPFSKKSSPKFGKLMIALLTIFCLILFCGLVVKHTEAQYWKRRYLNYAGLDESNLVTEDVREYYLMNREECK